LLYPLKLAFHPGAGRANAAGGALGVAQRVARAEGNQLADVGLQVFSRDFIDQLLNFRIGRRQQGGGLGLGEGGNGRQQQKQSKFHSGKVG
jgi:hypothetical protein